MAENHLPREENSAQTDAVMAEFLVGVVAEHWRDFYSQSEEDRLGDEECWDVILRNSIVEMGFDPDEAENLCVIAKLDAQFE